MKKFFLTALMLTFASSVFAAETEYVLTPYSYGPGNGLYAEPCPQNPSGPTPANGWCAAGQVCPIGYDPVAKYCFGGGLHRCGIACQSNGMYRGGR